MQRLFTTARWDEDLVRDDVRGYVAAAGLARRPGQGRGDPLVRGGTSPSPCSALAWLAATRAELAAPEQPGGTPHSWLTTSANEIRRLFTALCGPPPDEQHVRRWSRWRHHHQEHAQRCHCQRQRQQDH
jgi:hypothetical protein